MLTKLTIIHKQAKDLYNEYVMDWIKKNYIYYSSRLMTINIVNDLGDKLDPYNILNSYILAYAKSLEKRVFVKEEKKIFFEGIQQIVYEDICKCLTEFNHDFIYFLYGLIAQNREIGMQVVYLQKDVNLRYCAEMYEFFRMSMTKDEWDNSIDIKAIEGLEKFIATQEEAIESLIYIWNSTDRRYDSCDKKIGFETIRKVLSLSHIFVQLYLYRCICCSGSNFDNDLHISDEGLLEYCDNRCYLQTTSTDYNYTFKREWTEYTPDIRKKIGKMFEQDYKFRLELLLALSETLKRCKNEIIYFKNKEDLLQCVSSHVYISNENFKALFDTFLFKKIYISHSEFFRMWLSERDEFNRKSIVKAEEGFIIYVSIAWKALEAYHNDVWINPQRYLDTKFESKINDEFEKAVAKQLKAAFPRGHIKVKIPLSEFQNAVRELDVIFVIENYIFIIECKRLKLSESMNELLKDSDKLLYKYANQIEEEEREYREHRVEIFNKFSIELGVNSSDLDSYREEFILVTSETSLAHHNDSAKYNILTVADLVDYITKRIKMT